MTFPPIPHKHNPLPMRTGVVMIKLKLVYKIFASLSLPRLSSVVEFQLIRKKNQLSFRLDVLLVDGALQGALLKSRYGSWRLKVKSLLKVFLWNVSNAILPQSAYIMDASGMLWGYQATPPPPHPLPTID